MLHLTKAQLKELKGLLTEEKKELTAHFEMNKEAIGELDNSLTTSTGELSSYDNHPADLGTETFEKSRDLALDETLGERLNDVNNALELLKTDEYGKCNVCGENIPFERLQALPTATRCIEHASDTGLSQDRPVEEQVMTPPPAGAGEKRQADSGHFDEADAWNAVEKYGNASDTVKPDAN
ncbi:YteA family regulatory protein [Paenibacillus castaneae]|uniref:TraR/DksA C4-type zinc finger protein n=1 Tax=Paenibacillus castaneae TaxID=474957 RepID=UPI000C99F8DC|nr:TraR/DksA C4-type zinc finger protein [Paenibacillus castaneae]NIK75142.1 YteA family regulatory protein [Paenibacillus castaneae]